MRMQGNDGVPSVADLALEVTGDSHAAQLGAPAFGDLVLHAAAQVFGRRVAELAHMDGSRDLTDATRPSEAFLHYRRSP